MCQRYLHIESTDSMMIALLSQEEVVNVHTYKIGQQWDCSMPALSCCTFAAPMGQSWPKLGSIL